MLQNFASIFHYLGCVIMTKIDDCDYGNHQWLIKIYASCVRQVEPAVVFCYRWLLMTKPFKNTGLHWYLGLPWASHHCIIALCVAHIIGQNHHIWIAFAVRLLTNVSGIYIFPVDFLISMLWGDIPEARHRQEVMSNFHTESFLCMCFICAYV